MSELTKSNIGQIDLQSCSGYCQLRRNSKCLLPTGQQKYWKTLPWINEDMSKASKTLHIWHKREVHRRPQRLRLVKRAGMAPDKC